MHISPKESMNDCNSLADGCCCDIDCIMYCVCVNVIYAREEDITFAAHHDKDENKQAYLGRARGKHTFFDYQQKATRGYVVELKLLSRTAEDFHQHWHGCTSLFPYCHTNSISNKVHNGGQ